MENTITENKPGYKKTKLGWIPEDWEICRIKDVLTIGSGKDYKHLKNGTIPVYGSGGVMTFVDEFLYDGESVGIGRKGTIDKPILLDGKFWTVDTLFYTHSFKNSIPKFIFNVFLTIPWKRYNAASSIPSLSKSTIDNIKIKLPPLPEQKATANCLSTWDTAITKLDALIKAKQKLKKALMQQLLSGKKRLHGFEGEWLTERFDYFLDYTPRPIDKPQNAFTKLGIRSHCKGTFQNENFEPASIAINTLYLVKENDLIVNITFAWEGAIAIVKSIDDGALVSHRFPTYTFKEGVSDVEYFRQFIQTKKFRYLLELISPGGAGRNRVLSKKELNKLKINIPSIKEQTAIAQVLNTADQEINLLTNQRNQLQLQKKGLMQQLLTGKKRLKS